MKFIKKIALISFLSVNSLSFATPAITPLIATQSHEGPVYVASQDRLYFTTKPALNNGKLSNAIAYLDLKKNQVVMFISDANMANGMTLSADGNSLLVAEQGSYEMPGAISEIDLFTKKRYVLTDNFEGKQFNSPNKVIQNKNGIIYFSDPSYGYNQDFKKNPLLDNGVYAFDRTLGKTTLLTTTLKMPHGLALTDDDKTLLIGDTEAIDGIHPYDQTKRHNIYRAALKNDLAIKTISPFITIPQGIADGIIIVNTHIYAATAKGIMHYDAQGRLIECLIMPVEAFNLVLTNKNNIFITTNTAIYSAQL